MAQTGISSIQASNATYTSGKVIFTGVGGGVTVSSNTGQRVDISVAAPVAQTVQTQNLIDLTLSGNTSGALALVSSGTLTLAGGNNITLSQAGNAITISGGAGGVQTGISGIAGSNTTYTSGTVSFTGVGGGITVSSNTGQRIDLSVAAQSVQIVQSALQGSDTTYTSGKVIITGVGGGITVSSNTGQRIDLSVAAPVAQTAQTGISGIAGSNTTYTSGTVSITGVGGGVTVSSNTGQRIDISVAAPVAQTVQTQNLVDITLSSNTAGVLALISSGTLTLAGGNNITLSQAGNAITISGANAGGAQTAISGIAASDTTYTSGTVSFTGVGGGVTISSNTGQRVDISVAAPVAQTVQTQNLFDISVSTTAGGGTAGTMALLSSGTLTLYAGNNITLSQSATNKIVISGPNTSAQQTGISSIAATNTTYTSGQVEFTGSNMVTVKSSANQRVVIDATQSVQTQNLVAVSATNTLYSSGTVLFTGSNMITVKSSAAGQTVILDATQSVQTQNLMDLTISSNTGGVGALISSGTLTLAGGANITLSQNAGNAITIIGGAGGAGFGAGISGGNTSGNTGTVSGTVYFAGSNNITLSGSTAAGVETISISGPNMLSVGMSTEGNTAGSTGVVSKRMILVGSGVISLSQSTDAAGSQASVSILGPATTSLSASTNITLNVAGSTIKFSVADPPKAHGWQNMELQNAGLVTHISAISKTPYFWDEFIPGGMTLNSVGFHFSNIATATLQSFDIHFGVYTFANSTSAALLGSASNNFNVSTGSSVSFSGQRQYILTSPSTVAGISNLTPGNYLFGVMFSAGATGSMHQSLYGATATVNQPLGIILPGNNQLSTATSQGLHGMYGPLSSTVNALPANVARSDIRNQGSVAGSIPIRPFMFIRS